MAKLTTKARKALPASQFADPAQKKYPIPNKSHAANAKARAAGAEAKGIISKGMQQSIDARANKVLKGK